MRDVRDVRDVESDSLLAFGWTGQELQGAHPAGNKSA